MTGEAGNPKFQTIKSQNVWLRLWSAAAWTPLLTDSLGCPSSSEPSLAPQSGVEPPHSLTQAMKPLSRDLPLAGSNPVFPRQSVVKNPGFAGRADTPAIAIRLRS